VVLVRQYRDAAGSALLEIPAGTLNPGEAVEVCAHRELAEEIQYKAGRMITLFASYMSPGYSSEKIHTYLALDLTPAEGQADEDEFLDIVTMPLAEAIRLIGTGGIEDAKSISGLLYAEKYLG
jgi:ADP-ribose pyrophosphatase